jgi:pimeloyl-ACP methyl ester carboxylesterase
MAAELTSGYATAGDGHQIYYEVHGVASDPVPVVLLHGGLMAIQTGLMGLIAALVPSRRVVAVEYQGHGHTADRDGPLTLERMAADTAAVLAHLGIAQADFIGHSMGGMITTGVAIAHPDLVRIAGIVSAGRRIEDFLPELVVLQRDQTHQPSPGLTALIPTPEDFASWQAHYAKVAPHPDAFMNVAAKANVLLNTWPGWTDEQLQSIRAKTLLIIGDNDFFPAGSIAAMQQKIPGAQLAVLPGTTHMNILDRAPWLLPMLDARAAEG